MSTTGYSQLSSYTSQPSVADAQSYYSYHSGLGRTENQQYRALKQVQNAANLYRASQRAAATQSLSNYNKRVFLQQRKRRSTTRKNRRQNRKTRRRS